MQLALQGSKEKEGRMGKGGLLGKWGPKESKGLLARKEIRENLGCLDPMDLKVTSGLLDIKEPRGKLAFEVREGFKGHWDHLADKGLREKSVFQVTKAIWVIVEIKEHRGE